MTAEFGDKTHAGMGPAHLAGSAGMVVPRAHRVLPVIHRLVVNEGKYSNRIEVSRSIGSVEGQFEKQPPHSARPYSIKTFDSSVRENGSNLRGNFILLQGLQNR